MFWNYRQVTTNYVDYPYVREVPPIGSKFLSSNQGYLTPDGMYISKTMRDRVQFIQDRYIEICRT